VTGNVIPFHARTSADPKRFTEADRKVLKALAFKMIDQGRWSAVQWGEGDKGGSWFGVALPGHDGPSFCVTREPDGEYMLIGPDGRARCRGQCLAAVLPSADNFP
jgi:hypothetical protein